jgi:hypothetical protein
MAVRIIGKEIVDKRSKGLLVNALAFNLVGDKIIATFYWIEI